MKKAALAGLLTILLILSALLSIGCSTKPQETPKQTSKQSEDDKPEKIKIGVAISLTGGLAKEGNMVKDGYDIWKIWVNEHGGMNVGGKQHQVELVYYDDKSDAQTSAKLTEKLITEDKVHFLLAPYASGMTYATSTIGEKYKIITIAPYANAPGPYERGYKYLFGFLPPATTQCTGMLKMAMDKKFDPFPKKVAILSPDDMFPLAAAEGARDWAIENGFDVIYFQKYPKGLNDFSQIVTSMKSLNPDVLINTGYFEEQTLLIKQMKEMNLSVKMYGNMASPSMDDWSKVLGKDGDFAYAQAFVGPTPNMNYEDPVFGNTREYVKYFTSKLGKEPEAFNGGATASAVSLQAAIEKAGSLDTEKVRQALLEIDISTLFMPVKYGTMGKMEQVNTKGSPVVIQRLDGQGYAVWPSEIKDKSEVYPTPPWSARK